MNHNIVEIYSDGSCSGNPGPGGWASIIIFDQFNRHLVTNFEKYTTNNKMEMLAAINGIKNVNSNYNLKLYTDSIYLKNGITIWINNWKKNNWISSSKKPVANQNLWKELDYLNQKFQIEWIWVKGHNNNYYNEIVDRYAVLSMKEQKSFNLKNDQIIDF